MSTTSLNDTLAQREARIEQVLAYIQQTQKLFEKYASSELKAAHGRFEPLIEGLKSDKVRIVVIGEFSRGKSRLVNALLGIDLLPSAKEATTAINTFLQSPPPEREREKYIALSFIDPNRLPEELSWDDNDVLKKWGTELDKTNKNARSELQQIDVFAAHELLNKGLVIIDTPGLESVVAHHEDITRKAIASAHIAIWVQSVEQLGGNSREWEFLTDTVRQHFRRFLTVVNMWDQVLEPEDAHDRAKPESDRVAEKMNTVRDNFRHHLSDVILEADLALMTNDLHLMGVSAKWALSDNPEQRQRSGINHLVDRIADLCNSGEAQQEIFYKPLKQLSSIQNTLVVALDDELVALNDTSDLLKKQNDLLLLENQITAQEKEQSETAAAHKGEHDRAAVAITKQIQENLVQPLRDLHAEIDVLLTESYIKREVEAGRKNISLPAEAQKKFQQVTHTVGEAWLQQKREVEKVLNDLKTEYVEAMQKHSVALEKSLGGIKIELPEIKIDLQLDLSSVIDFQKRKLELEKSLEETEANVEKYQMESANLSVEDPRLRSAQAAFERTHRQLSDLGPQPSPRSYQNREQVKEAGMYSNARYDNVTRYDDSNVRQYYEERNELKNDLLNREQKVEQLMVEEAAKTDQRQTIEALRRKAEREFARLEKERKEQEKQLDKEKQDLIADTLHNLRNSTIGELTNRISYLEKNASQIIEQLFTDQLTSLLACVEEQFMQPLRAKQSKREEVLQLFEQDKNNLENRKAELSAAKKELCEVMEFTHRALAN